MMDLPFSFFSTDKKEIPFVIMVTTIYHICLRSEWDKYINEDVYVPDGFAREGFIHCCEQGQIAGVLERYFQNASNLLLLKIDITLLLPVLRYEVGPNKDLFPHVYGPLNKNAVVRVEEINNKNEKPLQA